MADQVVFCLALQAAFTYVLHGKPVADFLFNYGATALTDSFNNLRVYITLFAIALLYSSLRSATWSVGTRAIIASLIALAGPVAVQFQSTGPSPMIMVLHLYLCLVATAIVIIEPIFRLDLQPEFWKSFFSVSSKAVGYVFTLFSAGLAVLQYVSKGLNETVQGYLTSLAYPAGTLLLSLGVIVYWLLAPAWKRYLDTLRVPVTLI